MKVELQCDDIITIPKGYKVTIKNGSIIFEKDEKFKDGDILVSIINGRRHNAFIYKSTDEGGFHSFYIGLNVCNTLTISKALSYRWDNGDLSYATNEERQQLFDKMEEQGLQWNVEKKKVEKIRWRAKKGESYYRMGFGDVVFREIDARTNTDNMFYNTLNYFRTEGQTKEAIKRGKETLRKYHEEIGE